ncbi:hypothetical protein CR513_41469, partial [Mucuna pruriens]
MTFERKRYVRSIMTIQADTTCPHNLVISFSDADYEGLLELSLVECKGTLIGFVIEQVEIRGIVELRTTFSVGPNAKTITIKFTIVNVEASYNIILGRLTLNKL